MPRVAGDDTHYTFALCRVAEGGSLTPAEILAGKAPTTLVPTDTMFRLPSATTIIGEVLAKPPSAMAWWGFRDGLRGVADAGAAGEPIGQLDAEGLEELLKARGVNPNMTRDAAGSRGTNAHEVLELLADGRYGDAETAAREETKAEGTEYCRAAIVWWEEQVMPHLETGAIDKVLSEEKLFSLDHRYAGTADIAIHWTGEYDEDHLFPGWEIGDAKTHKPAAGFTKKGAAYISDAVQLRAYRVAFEEMTGEKTIGNRTMVLRDKAYRKVRYLEDFREVPTEFWLQIRALYEPRVAWEKGEA